MRQLIDTVEDFQAHGIELRSLTQSIDTATPGGRLIFHIFSVLELREGAVIRERTSAGLQAARERGRKGGRPRTLGPKGDQRIDYAESFKCGALGGYRTPRTISQIANIPEQRGVDAESLGLAR
jgi:DNA invertase Pin-like site-specific DNA recombinase